MNVHAPDIDRHPTEADAQAALDLLKRYAEAGGTPLPEAYPTLSDVYPAWATPRSYIDTLPDLQNGPASLIKGADRRIQHVGISNFRLPLRIPTRAGGHLAETSVTGTVSLEAGKKGINMSRIMRSFYGHAAERMGFDVLDAALDGYLADLGSFDARLLLRFALPLQVESLRSGLTGWQYYDAAFEVVRVGGTRRRIVHLDYVYSSTCPCSLELSEHARRTRGQLATPHSQRSVARISVEVTGDVMVEDVIDTCRAQVPTETQVMVKREDEQAFAELNAANPIFVEDAARLFSEGLTALPGTGDHRVVASHQESLHSHDAVSVLTQGDLFAAETLEPRLFGTLVHAG
ncbi:MAG: GTP cyclohydrolase FolE2 [Pseudomonadota bacterium]